MGRPSCPKKIAKKFFFKKLGGFSVCVLQKMLFLGSQTIFFTVIADGFTVKTTWLLSATFGYYRIVNKP